MLLSWGKLFNRFALAPYLFQTSVLHSMPLSGAPNSIRLRGLIYVSL